LPPAWPPNPSPPGISLLLPGCSPVSILWTVDCRRIPGHLLSWQLQLAAAEAGKISSAVKLRTIYQKTELLRLLLRHKEEKEFIGLIHPIAQHLTKSEIVNRKSEIQMTVHRAKLATFAGCK
jgi:hypothetical protein